MKIAFASMSNIKQSVQQNLMKQSVQTRVTSPFPSPYANDPRNITNKNYQNMVSVSDAVKRELTELV